MAADWPTARIADVASRVAMGPFGSAIRVETFVADGVPVISGQHLHGYRVDSSVGFNFVTEEHANRLRNANVLPGDVVFTHAGNIGQVAMVPRDSSYERFVISQRQFYVRCDESKVLPEYLVAYFKSHSGQHQLLANRTQVGVPSIAQPVSYLRTIEIPLPPIGEQVAITSILMALDDKIGLNRRTNETLEAMARALFKSWFIDFDPVRVKAEARDPALPDSIADLFPDRFEDSGLGEIPVGWHQGVLGDIAEHPRRGVASTEIDSGTPYIALEHMPRHSIALDDWDTADGVASGKFKFRRGEVLFGKLRPYFHKVGVAPIDGVCSTDIVVVRPREEEWFGVTLATLSSDEFVEYTSAGSTGTKMPRTSWNEMARYRLAIPPEAVALMFTSIVRPIADRIGASIHESRTLGSIRDALLPKLVSGQIRVSEVPDPIEATSL